MKDLYEKFAYDYDEFGSIDEYLGDEKTFFERLFGEHGVKNCFRLRLRYRTAFVYVVGVGLFCRGLGLFRSHARGSTKEPVPARKNRTLVPMRFSLFGAKTYKNI